MRGLVRFPTRGAPAAIAAKGPVTAAPVPEQKGLPALTYPAQLFFGLTDDQLADLPVRGLAAYAVSALAYICMRYRSTKLVEAPLWIAEETADGEEWLTGSHPLEALLEQPNPDMEMAELLEIVSLYLDGSRGRALLVKNRDRLGRVASLYPYSGDEFTVEPAVVDGTPRLYGKFRVATLTGHRDYEPDEVIFFRDTDPRNLTDGLGPLDAALQHLNIAESLRAAIKAALKNAVRPGSVVEAPHEFSDAAFLRLKEEIAANYSGVTNQGRNMLLEGGAKLNVIRNSLGELELGPVQGDVEATVCACFQVHPALLGLKVGLENAGSFADMIEPATDLFYDLFAFPRWGRIERTLTRSLLREVDANARRFIRFDTTKVRALQEDRGAKVKEAQGAGRFWTVNERRVHTGQTPLEDGDPRGDQFDAGPSALGQPGQAPGAEPAEPPTKRAGATKSARRVLTPAERKAAWERFDQKAQGEEAPYERAALALFAVERAGVVQTFLAAIPESLKGSAKADGDDPAARPNWNLLDPYVQAAEVRIAADYAPGGAYHQAWLDRYRALIRETVRVGGQEIAAQAGVSFTLENPRVQSVIRERAGALVTHVTDTTAGRIRDVIAQARREGVGVREIATRIREDAFGGDVSASRARTIARTETVGALNDGEHATAVESGVMRSKRWLSQRVGDARPQHIAEEDAGWVAIDQPYPNTRKQRPHDGIGGAEQDVNCRCTQLFSDLEPDEANREEQA